MNIATFRQPWMQDAVCATSDPDEFYPEVGGSNRRAKAMCFVCPAMDFCLQWALDNNEQYGVFGGMSADERRKLKKAAPVGDVAA